MNTVYRGIIEIVQPCVGRRMEMADFLVDLAESMVGAAMAVPLTRNGRGKEESSSGSR